MITNKLVYRVNKVSYNYLSVGIDGVLPLVYKVN